MGSTEMGWERWGQNGNFGEVDGNEGQRGGNCEEVMRRIKRGWESWIGEEKKR